MGLGAAAKNIRETIKGEKDNRKVNLIDDAGTNDADIEIADNIVPTKTTPYHEHNDDSSQSDRKGLPSSSPLTSNGNDCDVFDTVPFNTMLSDRASWLVGLLIFQSCSSFILKNNEEMLQNHLEIVHYLTMLVGAGGNAGNQACVRVIRGLALGTLNDRTMKHFFWTELKMGLCLSSILALTGCVRSAMFGVSFPETLAITCSLWAIVAVSIVIGVLLPLGMKVVGVDPAHSCPALQVLMDILGVSLTCWIGQLILETSFGQRLTSLFG